MAAGLPTTAAVVGLTAGITAPSYICVANTIYHLVGDCGVATAWSTLTVNSSALVIDGDTTDIGGPTHRVCATGGYGVYWSSLPPRAPRSELNGLLRGRSLLLPLRLSNRPVATAPGVLTPSCPAVTSARLPGVPTPRRSPSP